MQLFGWSWEQLHYEVSWPAVCRMLADGPRYEYEGKDTEENIVLTEENAEAIARLLNG